MTNKRGRRNIRKGKHLDCDNRSEKYLRKGVVARREAGFSLKPLQRSDCLGYPTGRLWKKVFPLQEPHFGQTWSGTRTPGCSVIANKLPRKSMALDQTQMWILKALTAGICLLTVQLSAAWDILSRRETG